MELALSELQIEQFTRDGYLIFRNMVTPVACELMLSVTNEHLRGAVPPLEYEAEVGYPGAPASLDALGGRTVRRLRGAYLTAIDHGTPPAAATVRRMAAQAPGCLAHLGEGLPGLEAVRLAGRFGPTLELGAG